MSEYPQTISNVSYEPSLAARLLPIIGVIFVAYLIIGLAMPVLPLHVHGDLGMSTFIVGVIAGSQFAASLISRPWAGHYSDRRGAKRAVMLGMVAACLSGVVYAISLAFLSLPEVSVLILLAGRLILGIGESFIITGGLSWGLSISNGSRTGTVMSWLGTALYAAYAVGAPIGSLLYANFGFVSIAAAAVIIPLITLAMVASVPESIREISTEAKTPVKSVLRSVLMPGLGLGISGVGFAAITTFAVLLFASRGWGFAWLALTLLSAAFMVGRLVFGSLPDRHGGMVAFICIIVEAAGLLLIWLTPTVALALAGIVLSGLGYSLVYPALGVEALRRTPASARGLAMGTFTSFLDLSLGFSSPALGLVAGYLGLGSVFLVSAIVVMISALIAFRVATEGRQFFGRNAVCRM